MRLVTVERMKELELLANERGLSYEKMMENAGTRLAETISQRFGNAKNRSIIGLGGSGNNGGDTLVALNWLLGKGWACSALVVKNRSEGDLLVDRFVADGGKVYSYEQLKTRNNLQDLFQNQAFLLDGIIGTGIKLPITEEISQILVEINKHIQGLTVIAVDCPSGIDCDSGEAAREVIQANLTVCMEAVKVGLVKLPAFDLCGEIVTVPIGLTGNLSEKKTDNFVLNDSWVKEHLPKRKVDGHKRSFGTVVVVGGSANYLGAPMFSGFAAYRAGAGLVILATPRVVQMTMAGTLPEATWFILNDENGVISEDAATLVLEPMQSASCIVVGPGIGREETTYRFLSRWLLQKDAGKKNGNFGFVPKESVLPKKEVRLPPMILDADALRWLAEQPSWFENKSLQFVLTPHVGEMAALTGLSSETIQQNREKVATDFAQKWGQVVVLKGALTVIAAPNGQYAIVPVANSALAKAGSGDALSGIIAALIGQGLPLFEAACAGAWIHARAGEEVAKIQGNEYSLLVREILDEIPGVLAKLNKITA